LSGRKGGWTLLGLTGGGKHNAKGFRGGEKKKPEWRVLRERMMFVVGTAALYPELFWKTLGGELAKQKEGRGGDGGGRNPGLLRGKILCSKARGRGKGKFLHCHRAHA